MEYPIFINREHELNLLNSLFDENKPKFVILYGRRRVGKTALLRQFGSTHPSLYLLARQESEKDQLTRLGTQIAEFYQDNALKLSPFQNWDSLLTYLADRALSTRITIIFDEFPYLVQSNKSLPSFLQDYWDNRFAKGQIMLILCGSSISMMESLLGYKNPLYGRRTNQLLIEPMRFFDAIKFFPSLTREQLVEFYAVLGGTPAYLLEFDVKTDLFNNIRNKVLGRNAYLAQDALYVLREELSEPRYYFSIIHSISKGNTKLGQIVNDTGLDKGVATKYLSVLIELQLIERRVPVTESHPSKSRRGIYLIKENFFRFWFRFIFENAYYIEQERQENLMGEKIIPQLPSFIGKAFENICLEWARKSYTQYLLGHWWDKDCEIDIVGIDTVNSRLLASEVKWSILSAKEAKKIIQDLREKVKRVPGNYQTVDLMLIARKVKEKVSLRNEGILVYDLEDIIP